MQSVVFYHKGGPIYDDGTHEEPVGWYFWHEDFSSYSGPYSTDGEAEQAAIEYGRSL
jgi:hypothetical protein